MKINNLNICVQVKCISFCSSNFVASKLSEQNKYKRINMGEKFLDADEDVDADTPDNASVVNDDDYDSNKKEEIKLKNLIGNVYIGKVLNVGGNVDDNTIRGKNIIGIFTLNSKINKDKIMVPYHDIIEYPCNDINNDYLLCAVFRSFYESYICLSFIKCYNKLNYIAIFVDDILKVLPFLKILLIEKFYIILIFLSSKNDIQNKIKNKLHEFHITDEFIKERIFILSSDMNIPEHVHNITSRLGVKTIFVYPNIKIDINILKKNIFTISALNAHIIFTTSFDYLSPHECKLLYEKGITIHFFNINNYIYYDYFKMVDAFNYVLLSILNKDIDVPTVSISKKYFSRMEEILSCNPYSASYSIYINRTVDFLVDGVIPK
ncbi:conserved Plasmodium protein, unknown function [Plasmodium malariae]|uniref:Uncharacterized protein n=1 Tax=Plasmodium malariae TaxID=5858 RepID=A0A1C3KBX1_PLAMA|nr:conserved Plasmodium protein, unknown function [Plasmodium malariae]